MPTGETTRWWAEGSAGRLRSVLQTWWELDGAPLADDKAIRAVLGNEPSAAFADIRHRTIELVSTLDENAGVVDGVAELLSWQVSMLTKRLVGPLVDATLAEAELLGVVNSGAPGELARPARTHRARCTQRGLRHARRAARRRVRPGGRGARAPAQPEFSSSPVWSGPRTSALTCGKAYA